MYISQVVIRKRDVKFGEPKLVAKTASNETEREKKRMKRKWETNWRFRRSHHTFGCMFVTIKIVPQSTYALISLNENGKVAGEHCLTWAGEMHSAPVACASMYVCLCLYLPLSLRLWICARTIENDTPKKMRWKSFSFVLVICLRWCWSPLQSHHSKLKVLLYTDEN